MTTIVAVRDGARTLVGSDTMARSEGTKIAVGAKWVRSGDWAIGIAGSRRTFTICENQSDDLFKNLEGPFEFTQRFRDLLISHDYDLSPSEGRSNPHTGQDLLLANPSGLWLVLSDLSVTPVERWAEGSGRYYGLGAMFAMREIDDADRVLRAGLEAAMQYDDGTGGEIWTDVLEA